MTLHLTTLSSWGGLPERLSEEILPWSRAPGLPGGWVVLPSRAFILFMQDRCSREGGALNLRFGSLEQVANRLGGLSPNPRQEPDGSWDLFLDEHVAGKPASPFTEAVALEGLRSALRDAVEDLRMASVLWDAGSPGLLDPALEEEGKIQALMDLAQTWEGERTKKGFIDRARRYALAVEGALHYARDRLGAERLLMVLPPHLHRLQIDLLLELGRALPRVDLWSIQVEGVSLPAQEFLLERLREGNPEERRLPPTSRPVLQPFQPRSSAIPGGGEGPQLLSLSAPGPVAEAREIAREVLRAAKDGIPFHQMGVLLRLPDAYLPLLAGAFLQAQIPFSYRGGKMAAMLPEARVLLALLEAGRKDYPRADLFQALRVMDLDGSAFTTDGNPLPAVRWDRTTRQAMVTGGRQTMIQGLLKEDVATPQDKSPPSEEARDRQDCARGLESLLAAVDAVLEASVWPEVARGLHRLAQHLFWSSPERAIVLSQVEKLSLRDRAEEPLDPEIVHEAVTELFEAGGLSSGRLGRGGVNILPLSQAPGLTFRAVFIPGMALRRFPPPPRENPILLDEERELLRSMLGNRSIPLRWERQGQEAWIYSAAVAGALHKLVLTYPGFDPDTGRSQAPSPYLLRTHEAKEGVSLDLESLMGECVETVPVFTGYNERGPADTVHAFDRSVMARLSRPARLDYLNEVFPGFQRMTDREKALRNEERLSAWDGLVSSRELKGRLEKKYGKVAYFSPTGLEKFAGCPYAFYLQRIVGLEGLDEPLEPGPDERIDGRHKGTMIHEVLERFHRWLATMNQRPSEAERRRKLEKIATEVFSLEEDQGTVGNPALWEEEKPGWLDLMEECIEADLDGLGEYRPEAFEEELRLTLPLPASVAGKAMRLELLGFADRIDEAPDGSSIRVVDYKTTDGKVKKMADSFMGGTALQLPLYLLAAESRTPGVDLARSRAEYFFLSARDGFVKVGFSGTNWKAKKKTLLKILGTIVQGIRKGVFLQHPGRWVKHGKYFDNCGWCDYAPLCGTRRRTRLERLFRDPPARPAFFGRFAEMKKVKKTWE